MPLRVSCIGWLAIFSSLAAPATGADLAEQLKALSPHVGDQEQRAAWGAQVREAQFARLRAANDRSSAAWKQVKSLADWRKLAEAGRAKLAASLGNPSPVAQPLKLRVTGQHAGDGFVVENVVYESRPGWWITANRYLPAKAGAGRPGILIAHAHHTPKEQGELQDMGMTWARAGCVVLVPDHLGHGERRQHPFRTEQDFPSSFRVSRQDYYFRYDNSLQLYLAGESLMGWMVWDLMRGVDALLGTPGVDASKIVLLGAVAGGGDPCAVTAALDPRIAAAAPFNFGGPQPETRYPLPDDAETSFNYAGSGSWESTRNLARSAADGFLPWVIVGSIAPRALIFSHEFGWDRPRDPVWKRLEAIYALQGQPDRLAFTHGRGELKQRPPEATHCTHIGRPHRVLIHAALGKWFGVQVDPEKDEYSQPLPKEDLLCLAPAVAQELRPATLRDLVGKLAADRLARARREDPKLERLAARLAPLLDIRESPAAPAAQVVPVAAELAVARVEGRILQVEPGIAVPVLVLAPTGRPRGVVVAVAQPGKEAFVKQRADDLAALLAADIAVVLPDLRGTGETRSGDDRSRSSGDTSRSATELMLGGTLLGARVRDLRSVLRHVREDKQLGKLPVALWGDSFAPANAAGSVKVVPHDADKRPRQAEPLGALAVLIAALYEPDVKGIYARGGLDSLLGVFASPQTLIPHDVAAPGLAAAADVADLAGGVAPRPVCLTGLVDGQNQPASPEAVGKSLAPAKQRFGAAGGQLTVSAAEPAAAWLRQVLGI